MHGAMAATITLGQKGMGQGRSTSEFAVASMVCRSCLTIEAIMIAGVQKVTAVTFCVTASGASTLREGAERSDVQGKGDMEPSDAGGKTGVNGDLDAMARAPDARSGG